ncbi:uncharacterized protein LOC111045711 [Nilaparvata lugens]|uniref:uncharacterized protein LOC111045711 n=1 Tax=Nilaparvata lugens TaxID=108931 RepID=UPI00193E2D2C|nr:uncharacterized protein LOC111045711 [Nilaparvata lugens]
MPWHTIGFIDDINDKVAVFNNMIHSIFDRHAPVRTAHPKRKPVPWMNEEILIARQRISEAVQSMNQNIESLLQWTDAHQLILNAQKTKSIILGFPSLLSRVDQERLPAITVAGNVVPYLKSVRTLGLYLDQSLSWKEQTTHVCNRVFAGMHQLKRLKHFLPQSTRILLMADNNPRQGLPQRPHSMQSENITVLMGPAAIILQHLNALGAQSIHQGLQTIHDGQHQQQPTSQDIRSRPPQQHCGNITPKRSNNDLSTPTSRQGAIRRNQKTFNETPRSSSVTPPLKLDVNHRRQTEKCSPKSEQGLEEGYLAGHVTLDKDRPQVYLTGTLKPGACFEDVTRESVGDCSDLGPLDAAVLIGGGNDIARNDAKGFISVLRRRLADLRHTRFGFRKGLSTTHALIKLVEEILDCFEDKSAAAVSFCDLSRAFDCVSHDILLAKLKHLHVEGPALELFSSYLRGRVQYVSVNGDNSRVLTVECGVPQVSVLGPVLFLIMIDDLSINVPTKIFMYADDTTVLNKHKNDAQAVALSERNLESVQTWLNANELFLNKAKTTTVTFRLKKGSATNDTGEEQKFLGIIIDPTLSWAQHIAVLKSRLSSGVFALNDYVGSWTNMDYVRLILKAQASLSSPDQSTITDYSQVKSEISMHFQRLHGLLQIRENYLLNLVSNLENYQINSLHDVIDQLSTSLSDAEVVLREAREAMRPEKFELIDANIILRSLQEVCSMPCFLLPSDYSGTNNEDNTEKMVLKFMVDDKVDATLKDYGMLTTPSRTKFVLKSEEDLPADYRADPVPEEMELEPFLLDDHHSVSSTGGGRGAGGGSVGGGGGDTRMSASLSDISASSSSVRVLDVMHTRRVPPLGDADAESPAHPPDAPIWMLKTGCPRNDLSPGTIEEVMMSHIMSPSLFYVHRKCVNFYMEQIRRLIGRALHQRAPPTEVKPGWIYLAKYSADNRWYRAKVIKFYDANKIHAQFIDFGNDEYITLANIEYSTEKIQEIPALATACKLHLCKPSPGPEWDPSAIKIMAAMYKSSSTLRMQVMENKSGSGRPVEVELRCFLGGTSSLLRDTLFFHGFATHTSTTNYTQLKSLMLQSQYLTRTNTHKPGSAFDGVVTYIKDPSNFYVNSDMIFYDRLMCELNTYYSHPSQTGPKFFYPSKGLAVAVFDEQQCGWFRAKVTGHPGNQTVELFYVDIGQTAVVKWEAIRVLEDKFLRASQLAVKCELYNVVPITGSGWPAAANEEFRKMALGQMVRVNVVEENSTGLSVVLYRTINLQEVCINGHLIEQQLAASTSIISPFSNHRGRKALLPTPPGKKKSFEQVITKPSYKSARTRKYRSLEAQIGPATSIQAAAVSPKPMSEEEKEKEDAEDEHLIMHENRFPCTIIKIINPSHFHVTFYSGMLEKLKQDITKFYLNESNREEYKREEEWKKGDNCVFQNKDRAWYRATIQSISDDKAMVMYIQRNNF